MLWTIVLSVGVFRICVLLVWMLLLLSMRVFCVECLRNYGVLWLWWMVNLGFRIGGVALFYGFGGLCSDLQLLLVGVTCV